MSAAVPVPANGTHDSPQAILSAASEDDPIALGQIMARSGLFPDIQRVSQAIVKILAGRDFVPTSKKIDTPLNKIPMKFVDARVALDEFQKWEKLYDELFSRKR